MSFMRRNLDQIIDGFSQAKVLVLGDLILDVYLEGTTTRLSPEAPVPVVNVYNEKWYLGGAANTAINVRSLGAEVTFCSVSGNDYGANKASELLDKAGIDTTAMIKDKRRHTIVKERIVGHSQLLARFDRGSESEIDKHIEKHLIQMLYDIYPQCDAVIVSDYNKGVITSKVLLALQDLRQKYPAFLAVDSKRLEVFRSIHPSVVKPNYEEVSNLLPLTRVDSDRITQVKSHWDKISQLTGADWTVVTLDEDGAIAVGPQDVCYEVEGVKVSEPHVIGAGDTFIAAFTLAVFAGCNLHEATKVAVAASSISVAKDYTSCCNQVELRSFFIQRKKIIGSLAELISLCEFYKNQHKKIVLTSGCFDILHSGHVNFLTQAGNLGDIMIVGINDDESIRRIKGPLRPINPLRERMEVLAGLKAVDHLVSFGATQDDTPISLIKVIKPHVFVKGGDYDIGSLPEADSVREAGGCVRFIPLTPDHSTTQVIRRISGLPVQASL